MGVLRRGSAVVSAATIALTACTGHLSPTGTQPESTVRPTPTGSGTVNALSNKIDLLVDVTNTADMGVMQQYLAAAIPDLIGRLTNPNCIDETTNATTGPSTNGSCPAGSRIEFPPVRDMHIGVVSSSLGGRLGDACSPTAMALTPFQNLSAHNDDQAHLLNRSLTYSADGSSATEGTVADASPVPQDQFLYWYPVTPLNSAPPGPGTPIIDSMQLESDFVSLIGGAGVYGCGLASQIESWYRFLIQPDPYASLVAVDGKANWSGVDAVILQQRHDFLRADSLVVVLVLSERNDREIDVRSLSQQGFHWMATTFDPPRGTSECNTNPADPKCISCAQLARGQSDPNCAMGPYSSPNDWGMDLALRTVHTKAKYGVDPQFPIQRYVNGLTSSTVPDRLGEYPVDSNGNLASNYVGLNDCTNPLFAGVLPDGTKTDAKSLCELAPGTTGSPTRAWGTFSTSVSSTRARSRWSTRRGTSLPSTARSRRTRTSAGAPTRPAQ
jgi:hypothetical protein